MQSLYEIFHSIAQTPKRNDKIALLEANKDNRLFVKTLSWLLNPFAITGISTKKINKTVRYCHSPIQDWENMMEYLNNNHTGTDIDIGIAQGFIKVQPEHQRDFYTALITKTLRIGINDKTVNAVYGKGTVPMFEVMLANKYFDNPEKVNGVYTITEKLDGFRLATIIHNDEIKFYSRQGQPVEGLVEVEAEMRDFCERSQIEDRFFDGELVAVNCEDISSEENYRIVTKIARTKGEKRGLKYVIFDTLSYDEFVNQNCLSKYGQRRTTLICLSNRIQSPHIGILPILYSGSDTDMIMTELEKAESNNKEGIMININDGFYEFKRSDTLLKVKVMQDADLRIIDIYEGTGRNAGRLGGIIVEFIHNGEFYRCECGSGFTDEERVKYWNDPSEIVGKIATIQFFKISKNENGGYGLRFPIWTHRIRNDKTEISMN